MKAGLILLCALFFSGCVIHNRSTPAAAGTVIDTIYVSKNPKVHMEGLHPELMTQIRAAGFKAVDYEGERPDSARFYMLYTANWQWDMAMYLTYFRATLYDNGRAIGDATYDSRMGGLRLDKFGATSEKLRPLIRGMLKDAKPARQ